MKKTLLALALSLIMIVSLALTVYASNTISYTVQSTTAGRGDTVELIVTASNATQVKSMGIKIAYNKEALEYIGSEWTLPAGYMMATPWTETQDAAALYMAPTDVSGNIFKMKFRVKDTAALDSVAAVNVTVVAKNGSTTFPSNVVQNGAIAISCPHTNTEPRAEVPAGCNVPGLTAGVYCLGCQKYVSGGQATNPTGNHADADGKWETDGDKHWHTCSCGQILDEAAHTGGTATCVDKAVCGVCATAYGTINAENHKVSTEKLAEDKYLVAGTGVNCQDVKKYYYECLKCHNATAEIWSSEKTGDHNYGQIVQAKEEVHTVDKLEPAVAAHYLCSVCQTYFTESYEATTLQALTGATPAHTYGAFKSDAEKHWKECSCGKKDSEGSHAFVDSNDMICDTCQYDRSCTHSKPLTHVEAKPAACTVDGNIEYWYCVDCLAKFDSATAATATKLTDVTVRAPGHIFATEYTYENGYHWNACTGIGCTETTAKVACDSAVKATCQQKAVCDTCGNTYTDFAPHDFAAEYTTEAGKHWRACQTANCVAVTDEANCSGGTPSCYKLAVCATCQKEYGTLTAHVISTTWDYKDATGHAYACTNTGCTYHEPTQAHDGTEPDCEVCGYVYHTCGASETTYVAAVVGNCMVKGCQAYYRCSCGKLYADANATVAINDLSELEAYGAHSGVVVPAIPATCTTAGATSSMSCLICGSQLMLSQVIPATGHSFGEWTTTLEPTDFAEGSKSRTCSACNEVETAVIPALGHEHTVVELPAVAPTCAATGLTAGSKCATCEEILVAQETVPAIDHATIEHVGANAATSTEAGNVEYWHCPDCETVWLDEERTTVVPKEEVIIPVIPETEPEETTQAPEETTAAPEETTQAPEETTAAPEETTQAPEDITVPEETTEAPVETTEAPEETTAAPEETTSPGVPSTGDNAIFFIVALIAFSAIFTFAVALGKKRNEN